MVSDCLAQRKWDHMLSRDTYHCEGYKDVQKNYSVRQIAQTLLEKVLEQERRSFSSVGWKSPSQTDRLDTVDRNGLPPVQNEIYVKR